MKEKFEESLLVTNEKIKAYKKSEDEDERGGEDEGGKENLQKFENKYGKWFGKKK